MPNVTRCLLNHLGNTKRDWITMLWSAIVKRLLARDPLKLRRWKIAGKNKSSITRQCAWRGPNFWKRQIQEWCHSLYETPPRCATSLLVCGVRPKPERHNETWVTKFSKLVCLGRDHQYVQRGQETQARRAGNAAGFVEGSLQSRTYCRKDFGDHEEKSN